MLNTPAQQTPHRSTRKLNWRLTALLTKKMPSATSTTAILIVNANINFRLASSMQRS
jgi:hypothetical protein